mgnify:CR=1 FL=1
MTEHAAPHSPAAEPAPASSTNLSQLVGRLVHVVEHKLSPGDLAALRRLDLDDPSEPAFWQVMVAWVEPSWNLPRQDALRDEADRDWASILNALVLMAGLHQAGRGLGTALASAGFSELRLSRLLRASDSGVRNEIRLAARYLGSKAEPSNHVELARLVLGRSDPDDRIRRQIARNYYRTLNANRSND